MKPMQILKLIISQITVMIHRHPTLQGVLLNKVKHPTLIMVTKNLIQHPMLRLWVLLQALPDIRILFRALMLLVHETSPTFHTIAVRTSSSEG